MNVFAARDCYIDTTKILCEKTPIHFFKSFFSLDKFLMFSFLLLLNAIVLGNKMYL